MSNKFNINKLGLGQGLLNEKSKELQANRSPEQIMLPISKITPNKKNMYSVDEGEIDLLVEAIRNVGGLKQPLEVLDNGDGTYRLTTGQRRWTALQKLAKEDEKYKLAPCIIADLAEVDLPIDDELKEKYLISVTNYANRHYTDADYYNEYLNLKEIYQAAVKNGYKLSQKMRNKIAEDLNLSPAQVGKMDYINKHATEDVVEALKQNTVNIAQANDIAHLEPEEQKQQIEINKPEIASEKPEESQKSAMKKSIKLVDTLTEESYKLLTADLPRQVLPEKFTSDQVILTKKEYAAYMMSLKKIDRETERIKKLLEKASQQM